jgi:hypothetical protein
MRGRSVEEAAMVLAGRRVPRTPSPDYRALPWRIQRYRLLADTMMAWGDWAQAAAYEERALVAEHQDALAQEPRKLVGAHYPIKRPRQPEPAGAVDASVKVRRASRSAHGMLVLVAGHCIAEEIVAHNVCASERATSTLSRTTARIMACIALPFSLVPSTLSGQMDGVPRATRIIR